MSRLEITGEYFGRDLEAMSHADRYHQWIFDEFAPFLGPRVAEIGAGTGNFSQQLLSTGVERLVAFEPSTNMFPLLAERLGVEPRAEPVNGFLPERTDEFLESFDAVTYVNVLEHVEDETTELSAAYATLRPGGHLLIFVPALQWLYSELDEQLGHYRRYDKRGLAQLVEGAGFSIERLRYFDIAGIIPWYVVFVLMKGTLRPGSVAVYDRWVVPVMRRLEAVVTPLVGKNLLLVARRD